MKAIIYIAVLCLGVVACTSNNQEEEMIDVHELMGTDPSEDDQGMDDHQVIDSTRALRMQFQEAGIEVTQLTPFETRLFPDRFGPEAITRYELITSTDTVFYHKWKYSDSAKVLNAFFNWMDCFGDDCSSIYIGEEKNIQRAPMQMLISDTTMIFITGTGVDFKQWMTYHETVGYTNEWNYVLEQRKRGKVKWFVYKEEERLPYEP